MLLAVDIGNTNITLGIFRTAGDGVPVHSWRLSTNARAAADEYGVLVAGLLKHAGLDAAGISDVAVASVVPSLVPVFEKLVRDRFKLRAKVIGANLKVPIKNCYGKPSEVGADRLVDAYAAKVKYGAPCIIVDFGTATTFDCVTRKGEYSGGLIVPGPHLAAESLSLHTAKLPMVAMEKPGRLIGKNTVESIQSGLYYGYVALVDGILARLMKEIGKKTVIVATGGLAGLIAGDSKFIRKNLIDPDLTLRGIYLSWKAASKKKPITLHLKNIYGK